MKVTKLVEDAEYTFRIMAQNRLGISKPLLSDLVLVQSKYCELPHCLIVNVCNTSPLMNILFILALPGSPSAPQVTAVTQNSATLIWNEPVQNGGTDITGYVIEKKETKGPRWIRATRNPITQLRYVCSGLIEGVEYVFRVYAINVKGDGK